MEYLKEKYYPVLSEWTFLKGVRGNYFLFDFLSAKEYRVTDFQANLLVYCDGSTNLSQLFEKFSVSREKLTVFLKKFEVEALLKFTSETSASSKMAKLQIPPPYLKEVHVDVTSACNLRCRHCYQEPYLNPLSSGTDLRTEEILNLLDQMRELNVTKFVLSGGEPFLRTDLLEIIDYAFSQGIFLSTLFTNGTIANSSIVNYLSSYKFPTYIAVSIDGDDSESHDFLRGQGSFQKTIDFLKLLRSFKYQGARFQYLVDTIVHRRNYKKLLSMFNLFRSIGVPRWRIAMPRDQGSYTSFKSEIGVNETEVFSEYEKLIREYLTYFRNIGNYLPMDIQIESIFRTSMLTKKRINVFFLSDSCCEYKRNAIAIKPNGDVTICTAFTNLALGNIRENSLAEIWYSDKTQKIKNLSIGEIEECKDCQYIAFCGTGCRRMALDKRNSLFAKDESACPVYEFFYEWVWPILQQQGVKIVTL
ncbi:MAG: radical SAM protein [Minisyncoccales bacterium]